MPSTVPILVLEDQPVIQARLQSLLVSRADFQLLQICGSAEEAFQLLQFVRPQIFLVDLELPGMNGEDLIPMVRQKYPDIKIVVFTVFEDHARIVRLLKSGIRGYLLKDISDDLLLAELRVIVAGGSTLTERVAQTLLGEINQVSAKEASVLTERETEVMNLIALGLNYKDIAEDLEISPHTVRRHINHIYEKLEVNSKIEAMNRARQMGLLGDA
ncbi:MAG: response regulator transcription factor [Turneriella sp.]